MIELLEDLPFRLISLSNIEEIPKNPRYLLLIFRFANRSRFFVEVDVTMRFEAETSAAVTIQIHHFRNLCQVIDDAVQTAFEVRVHRINANFRITLKFAVFEFFTTGLRVFAKNIAKNASIF